MKKAVLVKYGEIALRGSNRGLYENMLLNAIRKTVGKLGDFWIEKEQGRFLIRPYNEEEVMDAEAVAEETLKVFGVVGVSVCLYTANQDIENLKQVVLTHLKEFYGDKPFTFKIETSRAVKSYPMISYEVSAAIGEFILENMKNSTVKVNEPMSVVRVELRGKAYIYSKTEKGGGGLPPGSSGKGVLLLSGGIDSPVAGYLAAKRGIDITAVYFHSPPYTSERAKEKVKDLAERLSCFTGKFTLLSVPFTDIQLKLCDKTPPEKLTILLKRAMLNTAEKIAAKTGAMALITGDAVGQVASQTLQSLHAVNSAATIPILRPLVCMDKQEIIDLSRKIGTYDISIRPYEDCCTIFVAEHPETKPKASIIENIERKITELDELIDAAVKNAERFDYRG